MTLSSLFNRNSDNIGDDVEYILRNGQNIQNWPFGDQTFVLLSPQLPFTPECNQIIYVEDRPYPEVRQFIEHYHNAICELFRRKGFEFIYMPAMSSETISAAVINYMFPYQHTDADLQYVPGVSVSLLKQYLVKGEFSGPSLIHYRKANTDAMKNLKEPGGQETEWEWFVKIGLADDIPPEWYENYFFSYRVMPESTAETMADFIYYYSNHLTNGYLGERYFLAHTSFKNRGDDTSDFFFDISSDTLMEEIKTRVEELRRRGIREYQLRNLIESSPTLSKLVITKDFRIILPDYHNLEIKMTPLPKAVFLLFLRHPEGILFKKMREYRAELLYLYRQVTRSLNDLTVQKSIDDVTDPTNNSINEKCARIRESFLREFDEAYAKYYFITGKRGGPKQIILSQEKIIWEPPLDKFPLENK